MKELPEKKKLPSHLDQKGPTQAFMSLLHDNDGICIGESHDSEASKRFLMENMPTLKAKGVTTIFLEHVLEDSHQQEIDDYMNSLPDSKMPATLKAFLKAIDKGNHTNPDFSFTKLIETAKQHAIKIKTFDTNGKSLVPKFK